jgi:hypothetical protein
MYMGVLGLFLDYFTMLNLLETHEEEIALNFERSGIPMIFEINSHSEDPLFASFYPVP